MILGVLVGCGVGGLQVRPDVYDSGSTDEAPVAIDRLDPDWSVPDEATAVTIEGRGFVGEVTVEFGRTVVEATVLDENTLVVTAPAAGIETQVDVVVVSELGTATAAGAFTWAENEPVDTGDPGDTDDTGDTDSELPNEGKTGGLVQFSMVQIACPACLNYSSGLQVLASAGFHEPTTKSWVDWIPREGDCVENPSPVQASNNFLDAGEWLSYRSGSASVQLRVVDDTYEATGLDDGDFVRNAGWVVDVEGGSDVPAFEVENAFYTPESLATLTPVEMLYTQPQSAFSARISKSRASFGWGPAGGSDSFAVVLDIYNAQGTSYMGQVFCLGSDGGSLSVPSGYLSAYPNNALLVIGMYRYVVGTFQRPDDGSTVETLINFGVIGTGVLSN